MSLHMPETYQNRELARIMQRRASQAAEINEKPFEQEEIIIDPYAAMDSAAGGSPGQRQLKRSLQQYHDAVAKIREGDGVPLNVVINETVSAEKAA